MLVKCNICNYLINIKHKKGYKFYPNVCSFTCFKQWLIDNSKFFKSKLDMYLEQKVNEEYEIIISQNEDIINSNNTTDDFILRSKAEKYVIKYLFEPLEISYMYEEKSIYFPYKNILYLPDFFLPEYDVFIEVKDDIWEIGAYKKINILHNYLPLYVITPSLIKQWKKNENRSK